LHLDHFLLRARNSGDWDEKTITQNKFTQLIEDKITNVSFKAIREDIVRFIRDDKALEIWSADYFGDLIEKIKFK
jgi:hypothetical protein